MAGQVANRTQQRAHPAALVLLLGALAIGLLALGGCTTTPQERGPFHEYLHGKGLE